MPRVLREEAIISKRRSRHKAKAKSRSKPRPQSLFADTTSLNDLSTWYDEIKEVPELSRLARRGKILLNIVRNTDILIRRQAALKTDRPTKALFNSFLGKPHPAWDFPRMKITQSQNPLSKTSKLTSPEINFLPLLDLHLAAEALFGHDRARWNIAHENLKIIGEGALELQLHTKLLEQWRQDKHFQEELGPIIDPDGRLTHEPPGLPPEDLKDLLKYGKMFNEILELTDRLHEGLGRVICSAHRVFIPVSISPRYACSGTIIELEVLSDLEIDLGTYRVIFPTTEGYVFVPAVDVSYNTHIWVQVPEDATHGCVFLYSPTEDTNFQSCVNGQQSTWNQFSAGLPENLRQYMRERTRETLAPPESATQGFQSFADIPECNPEGFFEGIYPSIEDFEVDGKVTAHEEIWYALPMDCPYETRSYQGVPYCVREVPSTIDVFSGIASVLTFRVFAARWLHIRIETDDGVLVEEKNIENPPIAYMGYRFTPPSYSDVKTLHVTLDVFNECMPLPPQVLPAPGIPEPPSPPSPAYSPDAEVFLRVRQQPNLSVAAVEVTQGVQHMESLRKNQPQDNACMHAKYPLASKIRESKVKIRFDELPGCKRGRIVVRASAGFYTAEDATQYFPLPFKPPQTLITYPREGDELRFGQPLQLRGQGFDVQTRKHLTANALEWSIDGVPVGKGRLCVVPRLELGKHVVTLRATDKSGRIGESKVNFTASRKPRSPAAKRSTSPNSKKSKST